MNEELLTKIDELIEESESELIADTMDFIRIKSERGEPIPGAPFGIGPRMMLDEMLKRGDECGFFAVDYNVGVVSLAFKDCQPDLGIWLHGDVVSVGDGWSFPPYEPTLYKGRIIGRGATDNKGQLAAIFNLFKIFKRLGVSFNYNPALYVGCAEESGMPEMKGICDNPDARGFINVCTPPRLSLVPDGSFPLGYGAKGMTSIILKGNKRLSFEIEAGTAKDPGLARAILSKDFPTESLPKEKLEVGEDVAISCFMPPRHSAHPSPDGTAVTELCDLLIKSGALCEDDARTVEFIKKLSLDITGKTFNFDIPTKYNTPTVVFLQSVTTEDGFPILNLRVRYPIELDDEKMLEKARDICSSLGFEASIVSSHTPYVNDNTTPAARILTKIANEITERCNEPYINGATYAHYLPNAYIYGMEGCNPPEDFKKGRGGAHGIDECVSVARLKRAMRIYARAMLALNETEW